MTVPSRPILFAAFVLVLLLLAARLQPALVPIALISNLLLVAACLWQGRQLRRCSVDVQRDNWNRLQRGRPAELVYRIENRSSRLLVVTVVQELPAGVGCDTNEVEVQVGGGEVVRVAVTITPTHRGKVVFSPPVIDARFPLGLARRRWALADSIELAVYPSLQGVNQYDSLRRTHALRQLGIHRQRMVGGGREFDQLRDYQQDDEFSDINWKATARNLKPITNVYRAERSQDVLLCVDCGRMMGNPVGELTALDHAVDASIMLAHVCNRQGDKVGLALFRDSVTRLLKPTQGMAAINRIVGELVDARTEGVFPSYAGLCSAIRQHHPRRCIIFLFTDLNDPQLARNLASVMPLLSRRHIVVVVSLRDPLLDQAASQGAHHRRELYRVLAARELADERSAHILSLHKAGVQVIEADARSLTVDVVNRYLSLKSRQLL